MVGEGGNLSVTNEITFGFRGSIAATQGATLAVRRLAFDPDGEQIKVGGHASKVGGTVLMEFDPASTARVYNVFVYDNNNLELDGGTVIEAVSPLTQTSPRVEVRAGSRLRVLDAKLNVPELYLNVAGGEYLQEAGEASFRFAHGTVSAATSASPELPVRITLNGGSLTFVESPMYNNSNVRSTHAVVNGGHLRVGQVNFSKSHRRDEELTHLFELNGGVLEADEISYQGGLSAVEPTVLRFNGGTLKVAQSSTATNNFISINGVNLLSVYLGLGGFVCDTAGLDAVIHQPLLADPLLLNAQDGGLRKLGAGCLTLTQPLAVTGPITVEQGCLRLAEVWYSGTEITVEAGGTLELNSGGITNAAIHVAAGGTLRLTGVPLETFELPNGSFEDYATGQLSVSVKHKYEPIGTGWTFSGSNSSGIQSNGSGFSGDASYYTTNGSVTAFIKQGTIQREFMVEHSGTYLLAFEQATRNGYSSWQREVDVKIDGVVVHRIEHAEVLHGFIPEEVAVFLTAGTHTLEFVGSTATDGNATVLIDAVRLIGRNAVHFDNEVSEAHFADVAEEFWLTVTNSSFEVYGANTFASSTHNYAPAETGWSFSGNNTSGIQTNGSAFSPDLAYHTTNGGVTALIREGWIQTTIKVEQDGLHLLAFEQATRNGYSSWAREVEVRVDDQTVYTITHGGVYHSFLPVQVPLMLTRGEHTLSFVGLPSSVENSAATVLIDAITLKRPRTIRPEGVSALHLETGATVILENANSIYLENIFVDDVRLTGALRAGLSGGAIVLGDGRILTKGGGTHLMVR